MKVTFYFVGKPLVCLLLLFIAFVGKYTLFAPTDEAFKNIPEWAGKIPLKELLKFHVARGLIYSKDVTNDLEVRSILAKRDIRLNIYKVSWKHDITIFIVITLSVLSERKSGHC
jgi:uncharacterized surface protein with fasciclin (FAS1) repeats